MDTIGERITKARLRLNMNQKELCEKTGITESTLSRFERGLREPRASAITQLSKALDVSFDYLMGVSEVMGKCDIEEPKDLEITEILCFTEKALKNEQVMHCGKPVAKEDINRLLEAIEFSLYKIEKNK